MMNRLERSIFIKLDKFGIIVFFALAFGFAFDTTMIMSHSKRDKPPEDKFTMPIMHQMEYEGDTLAMAHTVDPRIKKADLILQLEAERAARIELQKQSGK